RTAARSPGDVWLRRVSGVEDEDARMRVVAAGCAAGAGAGAVAAVADVQVVPEHRGGRVHAAVVERGLADELEVARCAWHRGLEARRRRDSRPGDCGCRRSRADG